MKVLFLDIDGVLNPFRTDDDGKPLTKLDDDCIERLSYVVESTGCNIVISSTWKVSPRLMDILEEELFPRLPNGCIAGCTHTFIPQRPREDEIAKYLADHVYEIENYVIVDDYDFELKVFLNGGHCVVTDALKGFTDEDAEKCIKILGTV